MSRGRVEEHMIEARGESNVKYVCMSGFFAAARRITRISPVYG